MHAQCTPSDKFFSCSASCSTFISSVSATCRFSWSSPPECCKLYSFCHLSLPGVNVLTSPALASAFDDAEVYGHCRISEHILLISTPSLTPLFTLLCLSAPLCLPFFSSITLVYETSPLDSQVSKHPTDCCGKLGIYFSMCTVKGKQLV